MAGLAIVLAGLPAIQQQVHAQIVTPIDPPALAQTPLFVSESVAPLNMLVMGRDHKLYYEAYNDASDLNGDGVIDIGYKPDAIDYYGYFNSNACYRYEGSGTTGLFKPVAAGTGTKAKMCDGTAWSGDFLNYLATSRMDALRRVLYGGTREIDTSTETILQATPIPSDAHTWGKFYESSRDDYDIAKYAPLVKPARGLRHLFAVTTLNTHAEPRITQLRVLNDSPLEIWDWVSTEGASGQDRCNGNRVCTRAAASAVYEMLTPSSFRNLTLTTWKTTGGSPSDKAGMDSYFSNTADPCGSGPVSIINTGGGNNNPYAGRNGCTHDSYRTQIVGEIYIPEPGSYTFAIDGDDAVDVNINGQSWGWYGGHGTNRSTANLDAHSRSITFARAGWVPITFRHVDNDRDDNWGLALKIAQPLSTFASYNVRLQACANNAAGTPNLRESSCKAYPNAGTPVYKPTGLLHDFGEGGQMHFGLLTGSYQKNIAGGTLRRNVGNFAQEVDGSTGQFKKTFTDSQTGQPVQGLVDNIDRLRNHWTRCGWIVDGPISTKPNPAICAMWGNPVGEMMFETLRYFSGADRAHPTYDYGTGASIDQSLGLAKPTWIAPYKPKTQGGSAYPYCARPVATVLSDINPSYDYKMPGSPYRSVSAESSALAALNLSNEVRAIGADEGIHGKPWFIGQSTANNANYAPTVKQIDDLALARGLSPQEPGKEGTYYTAGISRFASQNKVLGNDVGKNGMSTYSVALASPLPELRFPVAGRFVTIAPFSKTVTGGTVNNALYTPTNQIVDYYLTRIANMGGAVDNTVNGGRPYAEFRINYEDVEQGADHDMDAIARYVIAVQPDNTLKIDMVSEYAAGGYGMHMGYVIAGTTQDGLYLEVRDSDTPSAYYALNTPPNRPPGYCINRSGEEECNSMGLSASRTFRVGSGAGAASFLKDPLWYAAKYGIPGRDAKGVVGDPDNYFLVTNATTLKAQMSKAFNDILQRNNSVTAAAVSLPGGTLENGAEVYRTYFDAEGWVGDVIRDRLTEVRTVATDGTVRYTRSSTPVWSASRKLAARDRVANPRRIFYGARTDRGAFTLRAFTEAGIVGNTLDATWLTELNKDHDGVVDGKAKERIGFLRGDNDSFRSRVPANGDPVNLLGDIVNSSLVHVKGAAFRAAAADTLEGTGSNYAQFATQQAALPEMLYVGANDGMLHAFEAATGEEQFAFIPSSMRSHLAKLSSPTYGKNGGTPHRYFVDGTPVVSDVYINNAWRKVLLGSLGAGGRQVFALDITDPANPKLLWEFGSDQDQSMGYSLAPPTIVRLNDVGANKGKWVALVPNGYPAIAGTHATLFVLDVADGRRLGTLQLTAGLNFQEILRNGLSRVTAVDDNRDGRVDGIYAGDLAGHLWRIDASSGNVSNWSGRPLYTARDAAGARQAITAAPYVVPHPSGQGDLVVFGTGRLLSDSDKSTTQTQTIYGIWDRRGVGVAVPGVLPSVSKTRANLQEQSFTELVTGSGQFGLSNTTVRWYNANARGTADTDVDRWGWYVDLPRGGEQITFDMRLYGRGLFATSMRRTDADPCKAGADSTLYAIDPNTGGRTNYVVFDVDNNGVFNTSDYVANSLVSGTSTGAAGQQSLAGGQAVDSGGTSQRINAGVESGRQSWRRQPPNP